MFQVERRLRPKVSEKENFKMCPNALRIVLEVLLLN